ncbi:YqkE family protein [Bacillus sp. M6-12]|uniref:YqkE family protein n=1 Tax=Bacillus sp. M6-12 TaxID=2054166 RepID=UPI0015E0B0D6|nr:YqkE family protein [Bacillus sp. M6-12]
MKKKRQNQDRVSNKPQTNGALTLGDMVNQEILAKLKNTKNELSLAEKKRHEEEEAKRAFERKQKEKNKSFEELLNESSTDWRNFK